MTGTKKKTAFAFMLIIAALLGASTFLVTLSCTDVINPFETKPIIVYPDSIRTILGEPIEIMPIRKSGGEADSITTFPDLPQGMTLNGTDGIISGTPEVVSPRQQYTVKADNRWGRAMDTIILSVSPQAPSTISVIPQAGGRVLVSWSAVAGADSYTLYRGMQNDTIYDSIAAPADTLHLDMPGVNGKYRYAVCTRQGEAPLSQSTLSELITFSIDAAAPVISAIPAQTIDEDSSFAPVRLSDFVTDVDTPDSLLVWSVSAEELLVSITNENVLHIAVPDSEWSGTDAVTVSVTDPDSLKHAATIVCSVTAVNDTPVILPPGEIVITDSTPRFEIRLASLFHDAETPDSLLTYQFQPGERISLLQTDTVLVISARDTIWEGVDTLRISVEDPEGARAIETVPIRVRRKNDPPQIDAPQSLEIREGERFETVDLDAWVEDSDHADERIGWDVSGYTDVTVEISDDRRAVFTIADADWNGVDSARFRAVDPLGEIDTHWVRFIVHAVNDTPRIIGAPVGGAVQDSLYIYEFEAYDPEGDNLLIELVDGPQGMTLDTAACRIEWTPGNADVRPEPYEVTLHVSEAQGDSLRAELTWSIVVDDENDYPHAQDTTASVDEDDSLEIDLTARMSDPDGDPVSIHRITTQPAHGTVIILADSTSLRFRPAADYAGADSFIYEVHDGRGGTAQGQVDVDVRQIADAPVAKPDLDYEVDEDQTLVTNAASGVLSNDTDVDSDNLTAVLVDTVDTGSLTFNTNGSFVYQPPDDYFGTVTFSYRARDDSGKVSGVTGVVITVKPVEDPPRIEPVSAKRIYEGEHLTFDVIATDADGSSPNVSLDELPENASFDGKTFSWTPGRENVGKDTLIFTASDGSSEDEMSVVITVLKINTPPTAVIGGLVAGRIYASDETLDLTATAADDDGDISKVEFYRGNAKIGEDLTEPFTYTTEPLGYGEHDFYVVAVDSDGGRGSSDTLTVTGASWEHAFFEYNTSSPSYMDFETDRYGNIYQAYVSDNKKEVALLKYEPTTSLFAPPFPVKIADVGGDTLIYGSEIAFQPVTNTPYAAITFTIMDSAYDKVYFIKLFKWNGNEWQNFGQTYTISLTSIATFSKLELGVLATDNVLVMFKFSAGYSSAGRYLLEVETDGIWRTIESPIESVSPSYMIPTQGNFILISTIAGLGGDGYSHQFVEGNLLPIGGSGLFSTDVNYHGLNAFAYNTEKFSISYRDVNYRNHIAEFDNGWKEQTTFDYNDSADVNTPTIKTSYLRGNVTLACHRYNRVKQQKEVYFKFKNTESSFIPLPYKKGVGENILDHDLYLLSFFGDGANGGPVAFLNEGSSSSHTLHIFKLKILP